MIKVKIKKNIEEMYSSSGNFGHRHTNISPEDEHAGHVERSKHQGLRNVTTEDIAKSITEELLDEGKEKDLLDSYWKDHEDDYRKILMWVYGRTMPAYAPPTFTKLEKPSQMIVRASGPMKKDFAPERQKRIKFLNWMTKMHKAGDSPRKIIDAVSLFLKFSSQMKNKDINSYKSPDHVVAAYKEDVVRPRVAKRRKERGEREGKFVGPEEREFIYKDNNIEVVRPFTVNASCEYGKRTKWCIAQDGNEYFDDYTSNEAKIYYFVLDDRRKPDDKYYKIAIELKLDDNDEIEIEGYWNRYDNDHLQPPVPEPIDKLYYNKVYKREVLDTIMEKIKEHAEAMPPERDESSKLALLDEHIWGNAFDNEFVLFRSEHYGESIIIRATLEFDFMVPMFDKHEDDFIEEAWEEALDAGMEGTLAEYIGGDDKVRTGDFEWSSFYEQHMPRLEDNLWRQNKDYIKIRLPLLEKDYSNFEDALGYLQEVTDHYGAEKVTDLKSELIGIIHNYMKHELNPEGKVGIENLAKKIWSLNSKFRYMVGHFEEGNVSEGEDPAIHFTQKKPFIVPFKIPSWNKPVSGYGANRELGERVKDFLSVVRLLVESRLEAAIRRAIKQVHTDATKFADKQTWIDFPSARDQMEREIDMLDDATDHKPSVDVYVGFPSVNDVRGKPEIAVEIAMMVTPENDPVDILWSVEYIRFIDNHFNEIYEEVLKQINIDRIQNKINIVFRDKILHKDEEYLKRKKLSGSSINERKQAVKVKIK